MTLCPIAMLAGCKKCPAVSFCPLKGVIGDFKGPEEQPASPDKKESKPKRHPRRS